MSIVSYFGISVRETWKLSQISDIWVKKWPGREDFEDKPRTGRPAVLCKTAKTLSENAKYKRDNSTRKISKQLRSKYLAGSAATVWRYVSKQGRKPLRRRRKPLLSDKQQKARSVGRFLFIFIFL